MHIRYFLSFGIALMFAACSQTTSASSDDEIFAESSSSKEQSCSSSKTNDEKSSAKETSKSSSSKSNKNSSSSKKVDPSSSSKSVDKSSSSKAVDNTSSSKESEKNSSSVNELSSSSKMQDECVGEAGNPWDGTTAKKFACGAGTKLSPYIIMTAEQLAKLSFAIGASDADYQGKYFKLGADIILNKGKIIDDKGALVADSTKLHKWTPIGNSSVAFTGSFDGDGHTVSGMFINTTSTHNGLFGNVSGTVQNVIVADSWVSGGKYTAGVVGDNIGTVMDVNNFASILGTEDCIGGVIGRSTYKNSLNNNSIIKNAKNRGFISGKSNVGGVAGCATYVTVDGVENYAPVEGYSYVGGIFGGIGSTKNNDVRNLKNFGLVTGKHFVGGVSGHCGGSLSVIRSNNTSSYSCPKGISAWYCGTIQNAYNKGNVDGYRYVGGIVGEVCYGTISNLVNKGDVSGEGGTGGIVSSMSYTKTTAAYNRGNISGKNYVGGIVGFNEEGVTSSAYSTGKVDGDSLVGLMIGYNYNTTMADYYYLKQGNQEPFGQNNGGGVATPKTADEMKKLLGIVPEYEEVPAGARQQLQNKLGSIVSAYGMESSGGTDRFVITAKINVTEHNIIPSNPISYNAFIIAYISKSPSLDKCAASSKLVGELNLRFLTCAK